MSNDLLRAQRNARRFFSGQRQCFIVRVAMQRLRAAEYCGQSLQRYPGNVVHWLLRRQRYSRRLCVKAHQPRAQMFGAKAFLHHVSPNFASGPVLSDLFEEVAVRVEEEAEPRTELIHIESAPPGT